MLAIRSDIKCPAHIFMQVYGLDMGCIGPLAQLDSRLVDLDPAQTRTKRCAVRKH